MRFLFGISLLALSTAACQAFMPPTYQPVDPAAAQAQAQGSVDDASLQRLAKARAAATASPGGANEAFAFAREVENTYALGVVTRGLAWAPKGDIAFYKQHRADEDAQAERDRQAARQKSEADRQAMNASFTKPGSNDQGHQGGSSGSGGTSGGGPVSVTIRSSCPNTVKVFYGSKPKYGSGTTSSISSNSVNSHTFQPGDMMWTVDDSDNGLGSVTVSGSIHEIQIGSDCRSISGR